VAKAPAEGFPDERRQLPDIRRVDVDDDLYGDGG